MTTTSKPVAVYIATPDIYVEETDIPNAYDLREYIVAHAISGSGENLDYMLTFDLSSVDYSTPGDYPVYAMAMDNVGNVDSDYLLVHVLSQREAAQYERKGTFPGLKQRLRKSQNPEEDDYDYASSNDGREETQDYAEPEPRPKKRARSRRRRHRQSQHIDAGEDLYETLEQIKNDDAEDSGSIIDDVATVAIFIIAALAIGIIVDMFI